LDDALLRYYRYLVLEREAGFSAQASSRDESNEIHLGEKHVFSQATHRGNLDTLNVELMAPCEDLPYFGMDEHCESYMYVLL